MFRNTDGTRSGLMAPCYLATLSVQPPFCPDLITSPTNSILSDVNGNALFKRSVNNTRVIEREITVGKKKTVAFTESVHAGFCFGNSSDAYCNSQAFDEDRRKHLDQLEGQRLWPFA